MDFREQVAKEIQKLTKKEDVVYFAWLCAVRALPFIGAQGHFDYWKEKDRKRHLYTLFRACDIAIYYFTTSTGAAKGDIDVVDEPTTGAADAARADTDAARTAATADAATAVADAVNAAATAAYVATVEGRYPYASKAAATRAAAAAATAADYYKIDIKETLLEDIENIQKGNPIINNGTDLFGKKWDNFQKALKKEGCGYWGRLYKDIFENSFTEDKKALKRRLNVPAEFQEEGAAVVADYLEELERQGEKHLNEARIIILGDKGAGKTCLARRLIKPEADMTTDEESTAGVNTTLWKPEHEDMNVRIWDFAGHTVTHAVHQFFLSKRCLYILVYDGRTEERNRAEYWLNQMKNYGGESEVFIFVNRRDKHTPKIPIESFREKYRIAGLDMFSVKNDKKELENFRTKVIEYIKNNPSWNNLKIPANYFHVKQELEQRFETKKEEYISIDDFYRIAEKYNIEKSKTEDLLKRLHALGISLHYEDIEDFKMLVLNPEWISHGIYKIINWTHEKKGQPFYSHK